MNVPKGWPTEEMLLVGCRKHHEVMSGFEPTGLDAIGAAFKAMLAVAPPAPAPEVEPVYQVHEHGDFWRDTSREGFDFYSAHGEYKTRILYTHPANDGLRKAAEEFIGYFSADVERSIEEVVAFLGAHEENLRAELDKGKS